MNEKILAALSKLDPMNDNHWTADGQARIETIRMISSDPSLTREMIVEASPLFNREFSKAEKSKPAPATAPAPVIAPIKLLDKPDNDPVEIQPTPTVATPEDLDERIAFLCDRISQCEGGLAQLQAELTSLRAEHDELIDLRDRSTGETEHVRNQKAITQFLNSQMLAREALGVALSKLPKQVDLKSPLDRALGARRQ